jgi:hypothetical protein
MAVKEPSSCISSSVSRSCAPQGKVYIEYQVVVDVNDDISCLEYFSGPDQIEGKDAKACFVEKSSQLSVSRYGTLDPFSERLLNSEMKSLQLSVVHTLQRLSII